MGAYLLTDIDQLVGDNLKVLRAHSGVSLDLVADHLGVSCQQIQNYESGKHRINAERLFLLAAFFEVSMTDFFKDLS